MENTQDVRNQGIFIYLLYKTYLRDLSVHTESVIVSAGDCEKGAGQVEALF